MEQKQRFINLAQSGRFTVSELCEEFGITRKTGHTFTLETVMSHPGKVAFLQQAQRKGYRTYLVGPEKPSRRKWRAESPTFSRQILDC